MTVDSKMFRVVVNTISNYTGSGTKHGNHSAFDPTDRRPIGDNCIAKSKPVNIRKDGCLPGHNGGGQSLSSRNDNLKQSLDTSGPNNTPFAAARGTPGTTVASGIPMTPRRPIFKIESQELLPTRRPSLESRRGSAGSISSLSSRSSRKGLGRMHRERFGASDALPEQQQPKRGLRSILKKTRPIFQARHQMHPHLDPMIQYRYLQQQQESMQRHQCLPQQHRSLAQSTFSPSQTQRGIQPKVHDQRRTSQKALNRLESSRPLPTPPAIKSVRWASYNEVLEIENVDELILLGYYNGYDRELGWDYRDESLDESSSDDNGEDEDEEDFEESDSECSSSGCTFEDEDVERQAAEDDLIQRLNSEGLLLSSVTGSLASSPPPPSPPLPALLAHPNPNGISTEPNGSPNASPTLRKQSPQLRSQPVRPLRLAVLPLRMQTPSPQSSSPATSTSTSPRSPISPISPLQLPLPQTIPLTASPTSHQKAKSTVAAAPPRLDRTKILADVAERKRKGEGVFARRIQRDRSAAQEGRLIPPRRERSLSNASSTMSVSPPSSDIMSSSSTSSSCASSPPSPRRMAVEQFPRDLAPMFAKAF